ncbi:hypothetical protein GF357_04505 [Candidatus Dojkabacteria bacterium]|nr:hypothetical protein [Candidatus Dojkabacteria bacterium]
MKQKTFGILFAAITATLTIVAIIIYLSTPYEIRVTNLTDSSATITWKTRIPTQTKVTVTNSESELPFFLCLSSRKEAGKELVSDEEKVSGKNHSATLVQLSPNTRYYFAPGGGFMNMIRVKAGRLFSKTYNLVGENNFATYDLSDTPIVPASLYGKVEIESGRDDQAACYEQAVVFIDGGEISPISTLINDTGGWSIDLSASRDGDGHVKQYSGEIETVSVFVDAGKCGSIEAELTDVVVNENIGSLIIGK